MTRRPVAAVLAALLFWAAADVRGEDGGFRSSGLGDPARKISLPKGLFEISGLAAGPDNSVYAHNDEYGIVYEIGLKDGAIITAFALGDPTVKADFEGIEVVDGRVYLITSAGRLYEAAIGAHRHRVRFNIYDTGAGDFCEIEGLSRGPGAGEFLLLCKAVRDPARTKHLLIFKWGLAERMPVRAPWLDIAWADILSPKERINFRPSAIERSESGLVILSARNRLFLELSRDGKLLRKGRLAARDHNQAEGVARMPSGDLVIADEGYGRRPGQITIYKKLNKRN